MVQIIYFVLRQYVKTAPKGPLPKGFELLLISFPPSISSSQGDARAVQVPTALWAWWWCRGIPLPVVSDLIPHGSENTALQRLISAVRLFYFLKLFIHDSDSDIVRYSNYHNWVQKKHFYYHYLDFSIWTTGYHLTAAVEIGWIFMIPVAEAIVCLC